MRKSVFTDFISTIERPCRICRVFLILNCGYSLKYLHEAYWYDTIKFSEFFGEKAETGVIFE
jgi:hypothetical protein